MSYNDKPFHLSNTSICQKQPHTEDSVTVPVWITQSSLDGLQALIRFIEGFERAGNGQVSGGHELVMFYRTLTHSITEADRKMKEQLNKSE
jgi:hypothetical protein